MDDQRDDGRRPWWAAAEGPTAPAPPRERAVAYYRHSAQDRQENSVPLQREQVRQWAAAHGVEVIHEFVDRGKSGLTAAGRAAFTDLMENWVKRRADFTLVLCLDVSRWGRFQDLDLSATYSAECTRHGKRVVYTTLGLPGPDDALHQVYVQFERFRAAQYSRELSDKVFRGLSRLAGQGYWTGGRPPYGFRRLLVDEARRPVQLLAPGQWKGIQNQRVVLVPGNAGPVAVVRRIFREYADDPGNAYAIAAGLNRDGVTRPAGGRWAGHQVLEILTNAVYAGTLVYNRRTQRLKTRQRFNPRGEWVEAAGAVEAVVDPAVYARVRDRLAREAAQYTPAALLAHAGRLLRAHGSLRPTVVRADPAVPSVSSFARRFRSLDAAYQAVFRPALAGVKAEVEARVRGLAGRADACDDYLVVDGRFTVLVQPAVPAPHGSGWYWYFRPDARPAVDVTLGVPVSGPSGPRVLGYLALPRLLAGGRGIRLFGSPSARLDLFGYPGLDLIAQLARP